MCPYPAGCKHFKALTENSEVVCLTTNVADVGALLMSVAQIVYNGGKVVF